MTEFDVDQFAGRRRNRVTHALVPQGGGAESGEVRSISVVSHAVSCVSVCGTAHWFVQVRAVGQKIAEMRAAPPVTSRQELEAKLALIKKCQAELALHVRGATLFRCVCTLAMQRP
jgi:hypothetical protein